MRVNRDFRFACPRWPLYTPKGSAAHETLVRHSIVPLQRPLAQLGRSCDPLKSLRSGHFADTAPDVCPFVARRAARAARQSAGAGSVQIITNPVRLVLNILTALKRSPLGLDLYLWLAYRTFALERQLQLSWRQVYRQFGVDPAKAGNRRTVDDFRKDCLREGSAPIRNFADSRQVSSWRIPWRTSGRHLGLLFATWLGTVRATGPSRS